MTFSIKGDQNTCGQSFEFVRKESEIPGFEEIPEDTTSEPESSAEEVTLVIGEQETPATADEPLDSTVSEPAQAETTAPVASPPDRQREVAPARPERIAARPSSEYWIQVASFSSQTRAENASGRLAEDGIAARISTFVRDDAVFYRVRVGPYGTKQEAEKFQGWLQELEGMGNSYVSKVFPAD